MATDMEVEDFLEHYGVKGMKWGVRKKSSKNSVTKAKPSTSVAKKDDDSGLLGRDGTAARIKRRKAGDTNNPGKISDADLRNAVNRLNMEKQYRELTKDQKLFDGRKAAQGILNDSAKAVGTKVATGAGLIIAKGLVTKKWGPDVADTMFPKSKK